MNTSYNKFHKEYLSWKRKNVTIRGMKDRYQENSGGARFGSGLYTAFLSNKEMARGYGKVYFVLGAIPKNPKVFNDTNQAEIWIYNTLITNYLKSKGYENIDSRDFYKETTFEDEMLRLGYDGLVIKGREMVNYKPDNDKIKYFETERQLINYYYDFIHDEQ